VARMPFRAKRIRDPLPSSRSAPSAISNDDRRLFLGILGEMAQRFEIELFAYELWGTPL